jgi:DNA-binding transcriptional LysR family regulator
LTRFDRWLGVELRHLAAFQAVADEQSFSRAATRLGYTQSAISHQIAALERIVGVRLIERRGAGASRGLSLTMHGKLLFRHASRILAILSAAEADMRSLLDGNGTLRVGTFQSVGARVFPLVVKDLRVRLPNTTIELTERSYDGDLLQLLEDGQLDLAFATLPLEEGPFEFVELLTDDYVLVVPADSDLVRRPGPLTLRDIAQTPLISFQKCRNLGQLEDHMRAQGLEPRFVFRTDDNYTAQAMVSAGMGAALWPRLAIQPSDAGVALVELALSVPPRVIVLAWHRDREPTPAAELFIDLARQVCAGYAEPHIHGAVAAANG